MDRAAFVFPVPWQQGVERRHFGIDELDLLVAVHRDAVVAVLHEVGASDLVQAHRRQLLSAQKAAGSSPAERAPKFPAITRISPLWATTRIVHYHLSTTY